MTREERRRVKVITAMLEPILLSKEVDRAYTFYEKGWITDVDAVRAIASAIQNEAEQRWRERIYDNIRNLGKEEES